MWECIKHVIKPCGAVVLFGSQPFTSALVMSNPKWFRQEIIWDKVLPVGFLDANRRAMRRHENIVLFSPVGYTTYNPQMQTGEPYFKSKRKLTPISPIYGHFVTTEGVNISGDRYPTSIVKISNANRCKDGHPTQKPVDLLAYLIQTYTNPGETVLDFTCGSGSTGVACAETGRKFIGIEQDAAYFTIAQDRIEAAYRRANGEARKGKASDTENLPLFA